MANVADALQLGIREQQAGHLAEAERAYRQVLAAEPRHAEARHLLGIVATQNGRLDEAIRELQQATALDPTQAAYHVNLGEAYRRAGQLEQAVECNERAARLQPAIAGIHANLGQLYRQQGNLVAATEALRSWARLSPDDARALKLLGAVLLERDQLAEAEAVFRRASELAPRDARARFDLGVALQAQAKLDDAARHYRAALELDPRNPEAQNNLGAVLQRLNRLAEAEAHYRAAIELKPAYGTAHHNLGLLLTDCLRCDEAVEFLTKAIELFPDEAVAHTSLGSVLQGMGWIDDAIRAAQRSIELDPSAAAPHNNLAICHQTQGRLEAAHEEFRAAMRLDPSVSRYHSNYAYSLNYHPAFDRAALFAEHRRWAQAHADPLLAEIAPHANDRTPQRRLRVGYMSAHLRQHAVNYFVEPILAAHDPAEIEVVCYSNATFADEVTARLRSHAHLWRDIAHLRDAEVCRQIRDDQIDILVDLAGHIAGERLLVFARKPAPVQVTYIGYQNTTGMQAMDYRLTDAWADPPGETEAFYTEKLVRLPRAFFCYRPDPDAPPVGPLPAATNGYVTFGSFNNFSKITPEVLATWAELLAAVPRSRLSLFAVATNALRERTLSILGARGVEPDRVEFCAKRPRRAYLELVSNVDIALDPFPFNGHTTTCDALWQGVPVLTLAGDSYVSRFGSSAHVNLGLEDWITRSRAEYVEIGARTASEVERLAALRAGLRGRMTASPLLDFAGFTRHLEGAYRQMWHAWCAGHAD